MFRRERLPVVAGANASILYILSSMLDEDQIGQRTQLQHQELRCC